MQPLQIAGTELLDALVTGVFLLDRGLQVIYLNAAAQTLLGLGPNQALGRPITELARGTETLLPLLDRREISFVSLQHAVREADFPLLRSRPDIIRIGEEFGDFADTAAAIAALDAVISVDTAVAHLAGAMGKPLFLLLPFAADFRWLRERSDSPWYPTARLYRQPKFGDWDSAVGALTQDLTNVTFFPAARQRSA